IHTLVLSPQEETAQSQDLSITIDLEVDSLPSINRSNQIEEAKASLREMIDQLSRPIIIT
ncbi:MAG: hypothetical protein RLZZ438_700, partial [Acidobacteriota bacterium]